MGFQGQSRGSPPRRAIRSLVATGKGAERGGLTAFIREGSGTAGDGTVLDVGTVTLGVETGGATLRCGCPLGGDAGRVANDDEDVEKGEWEP